MGRRGGGIKNGGAGWRIEKGGNEKECNEWIRMKEWEEYFREVLGGVDTRRNRKNDLGGEREREREKEKEVGRGEGCGKGGN